MAQRGHDGSRVCYQVNKRLLPVKGIYFTFIAGIKTDRMQNYKMATLYCNGIVLNYALQTKENFT